MAEFLMRKLTNTGSQLSDAGTKFHTNASLSWLQVTMRFVSACQSTPLINMPCCIESDHEADVNGLRCCRVGKFAST